jgi:phage gp46-like protein
LILNNYYWGDQINKNEMGKRGILHVLKRKEMHTEFWWRNQRGRTTGKA